MFFKKLSFKSNNRSVDRKFQTMNVLAGNFFPFLEHLLNIQFLVGVKITLNGNLIGFYYKNIFFLIKNKKFLFFLNLFFVRDIE